ncbi:MAG: hypothetical protein EP310_00205 [Bacteroidetes bacterium]|nr:MAG: hypothetical protein EP310_00205 [Bacteroidota bacterium]
MKRIHERKGYVLTPENLKMSRQRYARMPKIAKMKPIITGWVNYFSIARAKSVMQEHFM